MIAALQFDFLSQPSSTTANILLSAGCITGIAGLLLAAAEAQKLRRVRTDSIVARQSLAPFIPALIFLLVSLACLWFGWKTRELVGLVQTSEVNLTTQDYSTAEKLLRSAVLINGKYKLAHYDLARALVHLNRYPEALDQLKLATSDSTKTDIFWQIMLGDVFMHLDRKEEALAAYSVAITLGRNATAYTRLGTCYASMSRVDEAMREYRLAYEIQPGNVMTMTNLGSYLIYHGHVSEGVGMLRRAEGAEPGNVGVRNTLAAAYVALRQYTAAADEFRAEIAADPGYSAGYFNLAATLAAMHQYPEAVDAYRSYLRNSKSDLDASVGSAKASAEISRISGLINNHH